MTIDITSLDITNSHFADLLKVTERLNAFTDRMITAGLMS
jgi:hypothetical protein